MPNLELVTETVMAAKTFTMKEEEYISKIGFCKRLNLLIS